MKSHIPQALALFGATASGKTGLALAVADVLATQGQKVAIINVDARQMYRGIEILAATPTAQEQAQHPHHFFRFLAPDEAFSAGDFLPKARTLVAQLQAENILPFFVGGTGFYFDALFHGLSPVPDIAPETTRAKGTEVLTNVNEAYQTLQRLDPPWAAGIPPTDTQRITRGLVVYEQTGKPLSAWLKQPRTGSLGLEWLKIGLQPPTETNNANIAKRFDAMLQNGALEEVQTLLNQGYGLDAPALKAIGAAEIKAHLAGDITEDFMKERIIAQTRQYAKRQRTWLRNSYQADVVLHDPNAQAVQTVISAFTEA